MDAANLGRNGGPRKRHASRADTNGKRSVAGQARLGLAWRESADPTNEIPADAPPAGATRSQCSYWLRVYAVELMKQRNLAHGCEAEQAERFNAE